MTTSWIRAGAAWLAILAAASAPAEESASPSKPFRIVVVDEQTGRGVPLVELRTVNQILYVTDSNGVVAFDEPGLIGRRVFFAIKSHGYESPKDGFGIVGAALDTSPGGEARLKIKRLNVAERLYRVTGAGIYRDSLLTGVPAPTREPLLDGLVLGQDSVLSAVYRGKIHWFWGDTNQPAYPLGNFHTPGAVSDLPGKGGLDPSRGVDLIYFVDEKGFAKPTSKMPGEGPTWITGLAVLTDDQGRERMFANYAKIKPPMTTYELGAVEWDPAKNEFVKRAVYSGPPETSTGETLSGHTFQHRDGDRDYVYYCNPFPLTRVPADPASIIDEKAVEVFTCLEAGTRIDQEKLDRDDEGRLRYSWKKATQRLDQRGQDRLVKAGKLKAEEALLQLRDATTGKRVLAHGGSAAWNAYRRRWVLLFVEIGGTSMLGEMWFSEADTPLGPWVHARKIATHDTYSFYNPKQHAMFDQDGGRVVYFEGTYTASFSGAKEQTPRYEYNQMMYRLDLSDARLSLPAAVYEVDPMLATGGLATGPALAHGARGKAIAFFAPDRPGTAEIGVVEVADDRGGKTLALADPAVAGPALRFCILRPESRLAETTPIYEYSREGSTQRTFSIDPDRAIEGWRRSPQPVGRVWKNPGPTQVW
ncbi:hypothetical protein [Paludisphaera mucosa]|uniref:Uncharacterized protein n=1 Tax=Paludisphaera mucosa TaxID=3030827 RepID=A0ABT6F5L1_9BACT|nr:hypothetical protein [Paludisphaera mucosa]MDG3002728.1 hypothetical protein [Paludisphaera mucosa]